MRDVQMHVTKLTCSSDSTSTAENDGSQSHAQKFDARFSIIPFLVFLMDAQRLSSP
jgi:hypothetical protein